MFTETINAHMPKAKNIKVFCGLEDITNVAFSVELCKWPFMPMWGEINRFVRDANGRFAMNSDGKGPKMFCKKGIVWWKYK